MSRGYNATLGSGKGLSVVEARISKTDGSVQLHLHDEASVRDETIELPFSISEILSTQSGGGIVGKKAEFTLKNKGSSITINLTLWEKPMLLVFYLPYLRAAAKRAGQL
jgi:hypothetical protein